MSPQLTFHPFAQSHVLSNSHVSSMFDHSRSSPDEGAPTSSNHVSSDVRYIVNSDSFQLIPTTSVPSFVPTLSQPIPSQSVFVDLPSCKYVPVQHVPIWF